MNKRCQNLAIVLVTLLVAPLHAGEVTQIQTFADALAAKVTKKQLAISTVTFLLFSVFGGGTLYRQRQALAAELAQAQATDAQLQNDLTALQTQVQNAKNEKHNLSTVLDDIVQAVENLFNTHVTQKQTTTTQSPSGSSTSSSGKRQKKNKILGTSTVTIPKQRTKDVQDFMDEDVDKNIKDLE